MLTDKGWIGFDLDGTLAEYHGWNDGDIGKPIMPMVALAKTYIAKGFDVRIMTARVSSLIYQQLDGADAAVIEGYMRKVCEPIWAWCEEHLGKKLPVTCIKDFRMIKLYDDRAVHVEENEGSTFGDFVIGG